MSSPQGNALAVLDAATGKVVSFQTLVEVCGLAPDRDGFMVTTGKGKVIGGDGEAASFDDHYWDNHVLRIG